MSTVAALLLGNSRPRFVQHGLPRSCPIALYHEPRWKNICSGELGVEFVNATHAVFEFRGPLSLPRLQESVRLLVARHAILASHVVDTTTGPHFEFDFEHAIELEAIDLSGARNRRALAAQRAHELVWKPLEASTQAWFRVFVISLAEREHVIGFVVHHFICDGWSTAIIKGELLALYAALAVGKEPTLPELPIQYADYVMGMNHWITSGAADTSANYWRELLRCAPPTRIPPDFHPAPETTGALASQSDDLAAEAVARLRVLGRTRGLMMNAVVLAALAAGVAHLSGARDIVIVNRISGRTQPALLGLVGAFFDSVALRVRVSMDMSFVELATNVQTLLLHSYPYQSYPYQLVKSGLADIGASDLAPMLNFMDARDTSGSGRGRPFPLDAAPQSTPTAGRYNGFHTQVRLDATGLHATTEYSSVLYEHETAACFVQTLCAILDGASRQPQQQLKSLVSTYPADAAVSYCRHPETPPDCRQVAAAPHPQSQ